MSQGSATPPPQGLIVSDEGAEFQLQGQLGRGGMGVVFRAVEQSTGRAVALKLGQDAATPAQLLRFRREGEIAASLVHPGIVRVYSAGSVRGRPYLCFELVEGAQTLGDSLRELPLDERLRVLTELGEALAYAHAQGVVHRDVKPENVLIDPAGRARLTDFGVASARGQDRLTQTGVALGTPYYAGPEQLTDGHRVGPASDVWSLGVILYEALTDELPFTGESLLSLVAKVSQGQFEPPSALSASVPPALEAVCLKALAHTPEERYPEAGAFAADLARARRGEAVEAPLRARSVWGARLAVGGLLALLGVAACGLALERAPGDLASPSASEASPEPRLALRPSGRVAAARALAGGDAAAARQALAGTAPAAAPLLWARISLAEGAGPEALSALAAAPPGEERALLAYRSALEGGEVSLADELAKGAEEAPALTAATWAHLVGGEDPDALGRRLRRARRAGEQAAGLETALEILRDLEGLEWPVNAMWVLGEESQEHPRLAEALQLLKAAEAVADPAARRALGLRIQDWALPRLRYATRQLDKSGWRELCRRARELTPGPRSDAVWVQTLCCETASASDSLVLPFAPRPELAAFEGRRVASLGRVSRFLLAFVKATVQTPPSTPWPERRRRLDAVRDLCPPLAPNGRSPRDDEAWPNETDALLSAYLIEAHRNWEECWDAPALRAERLARIRALLAELNQLLLPDYVSGDWRARVLAVRVALLEGDLETAREAIRVAWTGGWVGHWKKAVEVEVLTCLGERERALGLVAKWRSPYPGWGKFIQNTTHFLSEEQKGVRSTGSGSSYPFPWRAAGPTRRLIERGWKPGEPLVALLDREL